MPGTSSADPSTEIFPTLEALPPEAADLLDGATGLFGTAVWWNVVLAHALPPAAAAAFVVIRCRGRVVALVAMLRDGNQFGGLTTPYSCAYQPLLLAGLDQATRVAAMAAMARHDRSSGVVRLDALPAAWTGLADLEGGSRRAGRIPLRFNHFGNWSENVAGLSWSAYLLNRPGALRETIRRRLRRAEKLPDARFALLTAVDDTGRAAEVFESVYERSWKTPEPYPDFNVALMRATAAAGWLRLGVWSIGAVPVAVQFWVVVDGLATVLKLAHDEAFNTYSPGTVLTALMVRHLLDQEHVTRIDFGRGDDPYKRGWAAERQQYIGILLVSPWRISGLLALLRHVVGRVRDAVRSAGPGSALP
jgi:hypothetical protein